MIKQKGFSPCEYTSNFEQLPSKGKFYSFKISDKEHVLKVSNKFEMKTMKGYLGFYLECDVLLLVDGLKN